MHANSDHEEHIDITMNCIDIRSFRMSRDMETDLINGPPLEVGMLEQAPSMLLPIRKPNKFPWAPNVIPSNAEGPP